jgi:hypothetical protein
LAEGQVQGQAGGEGEDIEIDHDGLPGVDVMITIFSDFCQFSAKKLAFFYKTNVMFKLIKVFAKTPIFSQIFLPNIF